MSTTTTEPEPAAGPAPSPAPTERPRIAIPAFARALMTPRENPGDATGPTREPGTSPGPGRDSPTTTEATTSLFGGSADESAELPSEPRGFGTPRLGRSGRRTSSSDGEPRGATVAQLAAALGGAILVVAGFAAWSVSRRGRWELRVPDDDERLAVATPLARIVDRHVGAAFLTADMVDGVEAASAVAAYAGTAPLIRVGGHAPAEDPFNDDLPDGYERP